MQRFVLYHLNFIVADIFAIYYYFYRYFLSLALLSLTFNTVTGNEPCGFSGTLRYCSVMRL